jgi:fibronectin type 3 domain-containing protein
MKSKLLAVVCLACLMIVGAAILYVPTQLHAQTSRSVALNWVASTTPNVTYNVYRSTVSGSGYSQINASPVTTLSFTDTQVSSGTTYFYVVRSFDGTTESANSNEAKAVIPQAPQPPTSLTVTVK